MQHIYTPYRLKELENLIVCMVISLSNHFAPLAEYEYQMFPLVNISKSNSYSFEQLLHYRYWLSLAIYTNDYMMRLMRKKC